MVFLDATSTGGAVAGFGVGLFVLVIVFGLYFVPGILATVRHTKNAAAVWVIDIFLGWTVVGWVVALAMAFGETREEADRPHYVVQAMPISSAPPSSSPPPASSTPTPIPIASGVRTCGACGQPSGAGNFCQNCGASLATIA
jgi:T4 superinfection immunity protein